MGRKRVVYIVCIGTHGTPGWPENPEQRVDLPLDAAETLCALHTGQTESERLTTSILDGCQGVARVIRYGVAMQVF